MTRLMNDLMNESRGCLQNSPGYTESVKKPAAQAAGQTLPGATPPVGKIQQFSKSAMTLNQYSNLDALEDLESLGKC